ncbi:MAG: hypothetical protein PWP23_896 [Candidatus Sumerlaeota bacterium]|nr:hypothetical protein [Candidatus Sumerlaeota bacterium]
MLRRLFFLLLLVTSCTACETVTPMLQTFWANTDKPGAKVRGAEFAGMTTRSLTLNLDVEVSNPYAVALPMTDLTYGMEMPGKSDEPIFSGKLADPGTVPAKSSSRITVPVTIDFPGLLAALGGVKPGSIVPYKLTGQLDVKNPLSADPLSLPFSHEGELPVPAPPDIQVGGIEWQSISLSEVSGALKLDLANPNDFAVTLSELDYGLKLNDTDISSGDVRDQAPDGIAFQPGAKQSLEIPLNLKPSQIGLAALGMLKSRNANYELQGHYRIETPFGPITDAYEKKGSTGMGTK